jgi:hypothetical protein
VPAKSLLAVVSGAMLMASTTVLQGCGLFDSGKGSGESGSFGGSSGSSKDADYSAMADVPITSGPSSRQFAHNASYCREEVSRNSETFQTRVEAAAPKYYEALKKVFTEDFVKYPFCLENRRYQVWETERDLRGDPKGAILAGDTFETEVENKIQQKFRDHRGDYESFCQEWSKNNAAWQKQNVQKVAQVLSLEPDVVEGEVEGFFNWEAWFAFFEAMQTSTCMIKYTDMCAPAVKAANRRALELTRETTGDPEMHWLYYRDNPHDVLGISSSSLVERRTTSRKKGSVTPVELKPTGHMLLRH